MFILVGNIVLIFLFFTQKDWTTRYNMCKKRECSCHEYRLNFFFYSKRSDNTLSICTKDVNTLLVIKIALIFCRRSDNNSLSKYTKDENALIIKIALIFFLLKSWEIDLFSVNAKRHDYSSLSYHQNSLKKFIQ